MTTPLEFFKKIKEVNGDCLNLSVCETLCVFYRLLNSDEYCPNDKVLLKFADLYLDQHAEINNLKRNVLDLEILAKSWMLDYDALKEKYEPEFISVEET